MFFVIDETPQDVWCSYEGAVGKCVIPDIDLGVPDLRPPTWGINNTRQPDKTRRQRSAFVIRLKCKTSLVADLAR